MSSYSFRPFVFIQVAAQIIDVRFSSFRSFQYEVLSFEGYSEAVRACFSQGVEKISGHLSNTMLSKLKCFGLLCEAEASMFKVLESCSLKIQK